MDSYQSNIISLYRNYIQWSKDLMGSFGGVRMRAQRCTGGGEYKNRQEHMEFFSAVEAAAGEYTDAFKAERIDRESLSGLLRYTLIDCHSESDDWSDWMLMAAEKHFLPIAGLLTAAEAQELYEPYRKLRRKNKGLPPQDEMLKLLKARAQ